MAHAAPTDESLEAVKSLAVAVLPGKFKASCAQTVLLRTNGVPDARFQRQRSLSILCISGAALAGLLSY
jgi:hypothetical protein